MTHWGWYWAIRRKEYQRRKLCDGSWVDKIDSFSLYKKTGNLEWLKNNRNGHILWTPEYRLNMYVLANNDVLVQHAQGAYVILTESKACNYGGRVYFFRCPLCSKRMRMLYAIQAQYQCRKCANLAYFSQRLRPAERFAFNNMAIHRSVKGLGGDIEQNIKPPQMHHATFKKLKDLAEYCDARSNLAIFQELRIWYGEKIEPYLDGIIEYEYQYIIDYYRRSLKKKPPITRYPSSKADQKIHLFDL